MIMTFHQDDPFLIHLECQNELQLIVCRPDDKVWLKLTEGSAEIFGSDLLLNKEYEFSYYSSVAVFSWTGCTLNLKKKGSKYYIRASTQTPKMKDLHEQIERTRLNADAKNTDVPIILITGPTDVGKSTLSRFLLNYAVKSGREPIFVDLDVGQSSLSITGTFGVLPINEQSDANGRFNEKDLCVYYFGYKSPGHNMRLYKHMLQKVAKSLKLRLKRSKIKNSGVVIDTCGWVDGGGYKLINEIIEMFEVNTVLVLSKASLYSRLMNDVSRKTELIFVHKFRDVSMRNQTVRLDNRNNSVNQYFYGSHGQLKPYTIKVNFNELQIYTAQDSKSLNVVPVLIEPSILYQVLALSYADNIEDILLTSIYGLISIVELDVESEVATILSPKPAPLPTNILIMGDISLTPKEEYL